MKKFLVIYHAPSEVIVQMATATPEQKAEAMKPWGAWAAKCGDQIAAMGSPLMGGQFLSPDGKSADSAREVTGYSILQAEDMDAAKVLLEGHPHLAWGGSCGIEVHESVSM